MSRQGDRSAVLGAASCRGPARASARSLSCLGGWAGQAREPSGISERGCLIAGPWPRASRVSWASNVSRAQLSPPEAPQDSRNPGGDTGSSQEPQGAPGKKWSMSCFPKASMTRRGARAAAGAETSPRDGAGHIPVAGQAPSRLGRGDAQAPVRKAWALFPPGWWEGALGTQARGCPQCLGCAGPCPEAQLTQHRSPAGGAGERCPRGCRASMT